MHFSIFLHLASHERLPNRLSPTSRAAQKRRHDSRGGAAAPPAPPPLATLLLSMKKHINHDVHFEHISTCI